MKHVERGGETKKKWEWGTSALILSEGRLGWEQEEMAAAHPPRSSPEQMMKWKNNNIKNNNNNTKNK